MPTVGRGGWTLGMPSHRSSFAPMGPQEPGASLRQPRMALQDARVAPCSLVCIWCISAGPLLVDKLETTL